MRPAEHLGQPVVAASAEERRLLRRQLRAHELEGRSRVVVEPPHQGGLDHPREPGVLQPVLHAVEVRAARIAQPVDDLRRLARDRTAGVVLAVQDPERVVLESIPVLVAQTLPVGTEEGNQFLPVGRPADLVTDRVQLELDPGEVQPPQVRVADGDHLDIRRGVFRAEHLDAELPMLAVAALLRARVSIHPCQVVGLERRGLLLHLREVGAHHRRGPLRAKGERATLAIVEGVHLLGHDVAGLAGRPSEELGGLEHRRLHVPVAVEARERGRPIVERSHPAPPRRKQIQRAPRWSKIHQPRIHRRGSIRTGPPGTGSTLALARRSFARRAPEAPRRRRRSVEEPLEAPPHGFGRGVREVRPTDRPREDEVADEHRGIGHERAVTRRVSRRVLHPDREPRERESLAAHQSTKILDGRQRVVEAWVPGIDVLERDGVALVDDRPARRHRQDHLQRRRGRCGHG